MIAHIPLEDFHRVGDKVLYIIEDKDLTYHSYHNPAGPVGKGITVFANLNIEGGIEMAFDVLEREAGKYGFKIRMLMAVLPKYGANAKDALPRIKAMKVGKFQVSWDAMIKQIESATETRKMVTFEEAVTAGKKAEEK